MELWTATLFGAGLILLVAGAEALVRGAVRLAAVFGVSPLVIGLTIVAFGTSAPEMAVSLRAAFDAKADFVVGNVVGSNIFNVLVILGLSALVAPLAVAQQLIRLEVPLMIAASICTLLMGLDGTIGRGDGLLLCAGMVAYTIVAIRQSRREGPEVRAEYTAEFADGRPDAPAVLRHLALVGAGLVMLAVGSYWLVEGAVALARLLGLSELVIGLTIIAAGTSLPEVATSVVASLRGERDIAVGNILGSNLFNLLAVLGLTAAVAPGGIGVTANALTFDIPVMIAVAVACLPVFYTGLVIDRWEGIVFLAYYLAYVAYLLLSALHSHALETFRFAMLVFVIPITGVTLGVIAWQQFRGNQASERA